MTVTYSLDVSNATLFGVHKLLFRWKGSLWKCIWKEMLIWTVFYFALSGVYRFALDEEQQSIFENVAEFCYTYSNYIPLTFMLGFYVSAVFSRWTKFFDNLGWIDTSALVVTTAIKTHDELGRNIRRNIIRYIVLGQALVFRSISSNVKRRFPTIDHLVTAGLMTVNESREYDNIVSRWRACSQMKYWVPFNWAFFLVRKARDLKYIESDHMMVEVIDRIAAFRSHIINLVLIDWVPLPLLYTQVVNLTVRSFFIVALMGRQYLVHDRETPYAKNIDLYIPIFSLLQFLFYVGWMKVAEVMLNPLGDDDDDFECNWIIDRNLQVGLQVADCYGRLPTIEKDMFWDDNLPEPLYTAESATRTPNPMVGSCNELNVPTVKRKISDYLLPRKWQSEQTVVKEDAEEIMMFQPRPKKLMTSAVIPNEHLRYMEKSEIPVFRYNKDRRRCSLDPSLLSKHAQNFSPPQIMVNNQEYNRRSLDNLYRSQNYADGVQMSPPTNMTNPFAKGKSPSEMEGTLPNRQSVPGVWMINEMLPPIMEEDDKRKSATQSSKSSNGQSWSNVPSTQGSPKVATVPPPETTDSNNGSFEKLKTLLKNASFASTVSSTEPVNESTGNQEKYQNLGYEKDWEEHQSAPGDYSRHRLSQDYNIDVNELRPRFRLSESSSNNEQSSSK
uniref:Bestrophin homolog n=2 Tax=Panagrolaimus sp. JU765 TaxID=591449 RepID=A0AC34QCX3_9BILA